MSAPAAPAERVAAPAPPAERAWPARPGVASPGQPAQWWPTLLIAGVLCLAAFLAGGGLSLPRMTTTEMVFTIGSGVIVAATVLFAPTRDRAWGAWPVGLLVAFTALTALSVIWSVQPDDSFKDAGRMLAYSAFFGASVALVRALPSRWPAVLGGVTLTAVVVCGYALLTKTFPEQFDAGDIYARLRAPYSYWNAIGLTAAMGAICCMWLGARRAGHALLSALAYPTMGLMIVTLLLAYSRGALVALALGVALWLCIVPLRLRGAAVLLAGTLAGGAVVAWDFSTHALSSDNIGLGARSSAGHQLGVLLAAMLAVLMLVGLAVGFYTGKRAPSMRTRRRAGALLLSMLALLAFAFVGALAASHRGLTGTISHAAHSLTDPNARVPNTPGRLTAVASVRARYWDEALKVFKAHPVLGAGAEGYATAHLRYSTAPIEARHAHGYIVQTLADLGLVGLALTLALLFAWMAAAGRSTHPFNRRWTMVADGTRRRPPARPVWKALPRQHAQATYTPERIGMLSMLCLVFVFGVHSLADWTWYVPGDACVALLCAGWLAGRGPLALTSPGALPEADPSPLPAGAAGPEDRHERPTGLRLPRMPAPFTALGRRQMLRGSGLALADRRSLGFAGAALIAALLAAWAQWQPQRSADSSQRALVLLASNPRGATQTAQAAVSRDPLSEQALFTLSAIQQSSGQDALARATLQRAVRLQPSNPQTWLALGEHDVSTDPAAAVKELAAAIFLNPESISPELIAEGNSEAIAIQNDYVQALGASGS
jgi:hypothetical protein